MLRSPCGKAARSKETLGWGTKITLIAKKKNDIKTSDNAKSIEGGECN